MKPCVTGRITLRVDSQNAALRRRGRKPWRDPTPQTADDASQNCHRAKDRPRKFFLHVRGRPGDCKEGGSRILVASRWRGGPPWPLSRRVALGLAGRTYKTRPGQLVRSWDPSCLWDCDGTHSTQAFDPRSGKVDGRWWGSRSSWDGRSRRSVQLYPPKDTPLTYGCFGCSRTCNGGSIGSRHRGQGLLEWRMGPARGIGLIGSYSKTWIVMVIRNREWGSIVDSEKNQKWCVWIIPFIRFVTFRESSSVVLTRMNLLLNSNAEFKRRQPPPLFPTKIETLSFSSLSLFF